MISISVDHISKSFGKVRALDEVSLDISPGEIFFLLGPSGCGKTTLLRTLAGFYQPESGHVYFDGVDVTKIPAHKRHTAMMFQSYALWPHLSVAKNIAFGLEEQKVPSEEIEARVNEALSLVKMEGYGERSINALSGGQQQRVALARALVVRPRCLLLDEPLSNLDAKLRLEMRGEIRRICREFGLTAIYVTHDQKEALSIADRMAILENGKVAQVGTPTEIYRRPRTCSVAAFIGETNFLAGIVKETQGRVVRLDTDLGVFEGQLTDPRWTPRQGEIAILAVRPESFMISQVPFSGPNTIDGHVTESVYLGEIAQYWMKATDGSILQISELNPLRLREPGEAWIHAHADPDDVMVLKPSPGMFT